MTLTSTIAVNVAALQASPLDLGNATFNLTKVYGQAFASGVGAGQADKLFTDTRTLAASASEDLDLAGVLTDALGASLALVRVKALLVAAPAANTNDVLVGGAPSNAFASWVGAAGHQVRVRPGGFVLLSAGAADATGYLVTAGTGDLLRVTNSAGTTPVTYDVIIFGTSA